MRFQPTTLTFLAIFLQFIAQSQLPGQSPESWPCWMGANHLGVSSEPMPDWPDGDLPIRWERNVGIGFSSVSIVDGRLYTMGFDRKTNVETVYCLNCDSGNVIWKHNYPSQLVDNLYEGGPGSTPTVHGGLVYTLGKTGQLFCFNASTGEMKWKKDLRRDLDIGLPEWGFNSSAFIFGKDVIFEAGRVVAYNQLTGEKHWQSERHTAGYGSAALFKNEGKNLIVTLDSDAIRVSDASSGSQLDAFPWQSPFRTNSTTPIVRDELVFISTAYNVGCGLFRFENGKLNLVYDNRDMRNHFNNSILHEGYLYGFDGNSNFGRVVHLVCMEFSTGKVRWKQRGFGCGSLMIADDKLLILSDRGRLTLAKADPEKFESISESPLLDGKCWTVPVYFNRRIYARNATGRLVCAAIKAPAP